MVVEVCCGLVYAIKVIGRLWKSGRKAEVKKNISKQKGRRSPLSTQLGKSAQEAKFGGLKNIDQRNQIFKEASTMKSEKQDIVDDKCIKDDDGNLVFDGKSKLATWKSN